MKNALHRFSILAVMFLILSITNPANAYIGPGAGFAFLYSFFVIFLIIFIAPLFLLIWPVWFLFHKIKTGGGPKNARVKRVIILGLDGLDPYLTEKFLSEGKMPNFEKLAKDGCFHKFGTTAPSVSPVAWSTFQTGVNPSKHNIFDFLDRDKSNYIPILSSAYIGGTKKFWKIGKFRIPRGKAVIRLLRKSKPFWNVLGENGVFSTVLRVPITFPPEKFFGNSISGMCVPDLRGSQGSFTCYTTEQESGEHTGGLRIKVNWNDNTVETYIPGPPNAMSETGEEMRIPLRVDKNSHSVNLKLNGKSYKLELGEYTEWIKVSFSAGLGIKADGICRFYLTSLEPDFVLYMSPLNIDPEKPSLPISHPLYYSVYLAKLQGVYATLGLAEDTWALNEGVIDDSAFHKQAWMNHEEREKMFFHALKMTKKGLVTCVFDTSDRIQHMFWRYREENHPVNKVEKPTLDFDPIEEMYLKMDDLLGRTRKQLGKDDVLIVISDHGFKSFRRCFNINAWLLKEGYLKLKEDAEGGDYFENVDWNQTKAYGVGLGGFFLNVKGREKYGIVNPGEEYNRLIAELRGKLTGMTDPETGEVAINRMYTLKEVGGGPYSVNGQDLLFGFNPGYRVSWQSVTGDMRGEVFSDNLKKWSGDHCVDYEQAKGIFFADRKITLNDPDLRDVGPTVIDLFGIKPPTYMEGRPLMTDVKLTHCIS